MKNINVLLQDAKDVLDDLNIPYGNIVSVIVNTRAIGRWGRCTRLRGTNNYRIEISSRLMEDNVEWEAAMDTMIHELLHAYPDRMCHTGEWKRCAELVNREYPIYNIKRCSSEEERGVENVRVTKAKYIIVCKDCGTKSYYQRETKAVARIRRYGNLSNYRCGKCKSTNLCVKEN